MHLRAPEARAAFHQQGCARCDCVATVSVVNDFNGWYEYAKTAPTDPLGLMTGTGAYAGLPCAPDCTKQYLLAFYKKSGVCRGWICCARQRECQVCHAGSFIPGCTGKTPGNRCYA
jgi:hypothetical protein